MFSIKLSQLNRKPNEQYRLSTEIMTQLTATDSNLHVVKKTSQTSENSSLLENSCLILYYFSDSVFFLFLMCLIVYACIDSIGSIMNGSISADASQMTNCPFRFHIAGINYVQFQFPENLSIKIFGSQFSYRNCLKYRKREVHSWEFGQNFRTFFSFPFFSFISNVDGNNLSSFKDTQHFG